jgi:uncharacterized protein (TIGR02145 family)
MDSVSIAWMAPASALSIYDTYEIHMETTDQFSPTYATLMQSVSGDLQAEISGLNAGTTYYVLIIAVSQSGMTFPAQGYWPVTTNAVATQLNPDIDLVDALEAGLGMPQVTGDEYVYEKSGDIQVPAAGSFIVGEDQESGYLRKVVSVTETGSEIIIETEQGTLSEAVTTGRVSSNVRLFSPERVQSGQNQLETIQTTKADGSPYYSMAWKNKLLKVEEQISPRFEPSYREGYRQIKLIRDNDEDQRGAYSETELNNQITLEASLEFEPELRTDLQWHTEYVVWPVVDQGEVIALGTFRADINARYEFDAAYNWGSPDTPNEELLWKRTWTSFYSAGGVPVFQEITLTLTSQAWAKASAEIDATASAFAQTVLEVGVRYNPDTKEWEPVAGTDFDSGLTATLNAEGTVEGEVRLVPNVEVKFYKVVAADLSIEPYSHGLINYTVNASLSGPTIAQFNNFDYLLGLDCNMHLTLWPIFNDKNPLYEAQLYSNVWPLFDLPQLDINTSQAANDYVLTADIRDGTNNAFIPDSIKWEVYDPNGDRSPLNFGAYDGSGSAVFTPDSAGTYLILLSGYGQLGKWIGDIARRYVLIEIESEYDPCTYDISPTNGSFASIGGSKMVTVTTSNSSCTWSASSNVIWASVSPVNDTGNGSVTVQVDPNSGEARSGTVTIAGKIYTINQAAAVSSGGGCGAYIAPGVWKEFDCYNLAAIGKTTHDDPFTPSWRLIGGYWQWGRKGPDPGQWYDTDTPNFAHGPAGQTESEDHSAAISGWDQTEAPADAWSDSGKKSNDPCLEGFRVPTIAQWQWVMDNNTQRPAGTWSSSTTNYSSALFLGEKLMLPAAGYRSYSSGSLVARGGSGYYWSSSKDAPTMWSIAFSQNGAFAYNDHNGREGYSVRCVADDSSQPLSLSKNAITLYPGVTETVSITGGTGNYTIDNSNNDVATAVISGSSINVTGISWGTATVSVSDAGGTTVTISVTVFSNDV